MTKYERWVHDKWRPAIGWLYGIIVFFDFVLAPIGYSILQLIIGIQDGNIEQWAPLTLKGAGLFHVSMLAIVGVTAYGRTQEKLNNAQTDIRLPKLEE